MQDVFKCISDIGIVPVVKLTNPQRDAVPLARALIAGGIPIMEVTFRAYLKSMKHRRQVRSFS